MQFKPAKFKGLTLVLQRQNVAPFRPMSSRAPTVEVGTESAPRAPVTETTATTPLASSPNPAAPAEAKSAPIEIGGRAGPEPTRFGDWEKGGRCIDF